MKTKFDWHHGMSGLPDISQEALKNYFIYGLEPGGFLITILCDRPWTEVIGRADRWNAPSLGKYLQWLQEYAPQGSWGSEEAVASWLNKGPAYQAFQKTIVWEMLKDEHSNIKDYDF
jgi:hypothetical protein